MNTNILLLVFKHRIHKVSFVYNVECIAGSHTKRVLTAMDHNDFYLLTEKYVLVLRTKESGHRFEVIRI